MLKERFAEIEAKLLAGIRSFYGERLVSVVVFGSVARATQSFDSDIDILIIARGLPTGRIKRIREFESVEDKVEPFLKSLQKEGINTYISAVIKSPEEIEKGSPLLIDMVEDAKILFDEGDFFLGAMERLRNRLRELGAKRVWKGSAWYWVLKPDIRPGEVFEL
ncbi:MAG: nucleotidyltransferase domain-containing protein [Deltaproteobacteria bacterium]|nr:nucleotidyltransferase domain-containing protein [Deltaproteobacteria bacterium]